MISQSSTSLIKTAGNAIGSPAKRVSDEPRDLQVEEGQLLVLLSAMKLETEAPPSSHQYVPSQRSPEAPTFWDELSQPNCEQSEFWILSCGRSRHTP